MSALITQRSAVDSDVLLKVEDLSVTFRTEDGPVQAVRGVSYELRRGEVLGIVGESGSGKSVTSMALMGLLPRTATIHGSAHFGGQDLIRLTDQQMSRIRGNKLAMIFQDPLTSLNPVYTVGTQIAETLLAHHDKSNHWARERSIELLDIVGIPHPRQRVDNYPHELSGGMRQRIVIAIAMANDPDVIIADEPTTALDVTVQAQVLEALSKAQEATGAAMVLITHDLGVIAGHADRVAVMYAGRLVETGTADEIFYHSRMPYTQGLIASLPRMDLGQQQRLTPIVGSPPSLLNLPKGCPFAPRCQYAEQICHEEEPRLRTVAASGQVSACHFADRLEDVQLVLEDSEETL